MEAGLFCMCLIMTELSNKNNLTQRMTILMDELKERASKSKRSARRMAVWRFTVMLSYVLKRAIDLVVSFLALLVLFPFFIVIAILIKMTSKGPVFFIQKRVGYNGQHFSFYKFRSMYVDAERRKAALMAQNESGDGVIFKMKNDPRITPIGRIMRRTSIDELPQFLNVLFGDMSLVGPRPPLPQEVELYTLEDRKRLNVKPGLTCLWQIKGRSDIPFKEQVKLDKEYIRSQSLIQDLWILLRTIPAIVSGRGAY